MIATPRYTVTVLPADLRFEASADESLLKAALRAGVPLRSSCRNGTCRSCLCWLASGAIVYEIEWPGLSAEEKRAGCVLPCVARPCSDIVLRLEE